MTLPMEKAEACLKLLVEGCSVRTVERITGVHRDTIMRLLVGAGERCESLMARLIHAVPVQDVQCDELWGYVGMKEKRAPLDGKRSNLVGDAWCFAAMERSSKLILAWHLGHRTTQDTHWFLDKLDAATAGHFQITTDGFAPYKEAAEVCLGTRTDFAQLVKVYRQPRDGEQRYSPAAIAGAIPTPRYGRPDPRRISTSHIERQNLTVRMMMRRMTRPANAFSKKWENLHAAFALQFACYNFYRPHASLRVTPPMQARVADHPWSIREILCASSGQ